MTEFQPIDPTGKTTHELLAELADGINRTHDCVHAFQRQQEERDAEASRKRHAMANEMQALQGDVREVKREVGLMKDQQTTDGARITSLAVKLGLERSVTGERPSIAAWGPWKAAGAGFGVLSGVVLAYKIAAPVLEPFLRALHHSIMAAH